jgi:hypothetical protein
VPVNLSGDGFLPGPAVDLDIRRLRVDNSVKLSSGRPVGIRLTVENGNGSGAAAPATVVGEQGGGEVYRETLDVFVSGGGSQQFQFPDYFPTATGEILWTATIADDDPDIDAATAVTDVK